MSAHDSPSGLLGQLVSTCPHCGDVFGLPSTYSTGDELVCPLCERHLAPEQLRPRTLRIAPQQTSPSTGESDSVLDTLGDDREHGSDSGTSLSGIEIGSLFDQQSLRPPAEDPAAPSAAAPLFDSSIEVPAPSEVEEEPSDQPPPSSALDQEDDDLPAEMTGTTENPDADVFESKLPVEPVVAQTFAPDPALAPPEPHVERSPQEDQMTAQLIGANAGRASGPRWVLPVAFGALLLVGGPMAYLVYLSVGGASTPERVEIVEAPDPLADEEATVETPADQGAIVANFEVPVSESAVSDDAQEQPEDNPLGDRYSNASADVPAFLENGSEDEPAALAPVFAEEVDEGYEGQRSQVLRGAPAYSYEELFAATTEGRQAGRAFADGRLEDAESFEAMGRDYAKLCYLAQVITLLDPREDHFDLMTAQLEAVDVFKRALSRQDSRDHAAQIAGPWLQWTGRPHGGIFFVGNVKDAKETGDYFEYVFAYGEFEATVVTDQPISYRRFRNAGAKEVGVLGVVVEDPVTHLPEYEGSAARVIWARKTVPLR